MKYILVNWPRSQQFMEDNRCFQCIEIEGALFVPEDVYERHLLELENTEFDYGHNVNHKAEE